MNAPGANADSLSGGGLPAVATMKPTNMSDLQPRLLLKVEYEKKGCCEAQAVYDRKYAHLYDNRIEVNTPIGICCGTATNDGCVVDNTNVYYFDRFPTRAAPVCLCIPATSIPCNPGPPMILAQAGACKCCGTVIKVAPHGCWDLKECLCCGPPCALKYAKPWLNGLREEGAFAFTKAWREAIDAYKIAHPAIANELATFVNVKDSILGGALGDALTTSSNATIDMER